MFLLKNQRECVIFVYFTGEYGYNVYICARRCILVYSADGTDKFRRKKKMKTTLISKDNNEAKLKMEFTAEEFDAATDKVFQKNRKDFQIRHQEESSRSTTVKVCSSKMLSTNCSEQTIRKLSQTTISM